MCGTGMISQLQIEHFLMDGVQGTMRRLKIMLVWLLPVLGLVGAVYGSADALNGGANHGYRTSISAAAGHGQSQSAGDYLPAKQALRNLGRRASVSSGSGGTLLPVLVPATGLAGLEPAAGLFRVIAAPPDLIRGWQFHCRTAAEPRAPSAVS